jgi:hypothetical protein
LVFSVSLIILGCAAEKGLRTLFPSESGLSDYTISDNTVTFKNDFIIVEVSPLNSIYSNENQPYIYIMELLDQGFTIFSIKIENLSNEKIMYNPSFTTIIDNRMGYNKPLDYTDIYDLVRDRKDGEMILKRIQGKFYDLATTIIPGESAAKLLIFGRLEEKSSKATLIMQEIYIGTETIELRFPFIFKVYAPSLSL